MYLKKKEISHLDVRSKNIAAQLHLLKQLYKKRAKMVLINLKFKYKQFH